MMSKGISRGFFLLILFIVTAAFMDVLGPCYSTVLWAIILAIITSSLAIELNVVYTKLQTNNTKFPVIVVDTLELLPGWAQHFLAGNR